MTERAARVCYDPPMPSFHDFEVETITGERVLLGDYAGQLCLVVNVASQ